MISKGTQENSVDCFLDEIDRNISRNRQVLSEWQKHSDAKHCNWSEVQIKVHSITVCLNIHTVI